MATKRILLTEHNHAKIGCHFNENIEFFKQQQYSIMINRPRFLAPEEDSQREWSQPIDIWHLGVILFELASLDAVKNCQIIRKMGVFDKAEYDPDRHRENPVTFEECAAKLKEQGNCLQNKGQGKYSQ